jgi:hypothetical protein
MMMLISGEALLNTLFVLVIWGIIVWVLWWALNKIAPPEPWMKIGTVILVLLTVVVLVNILLSLIGHPFISWH